MLQLPILAHCLKLGMRRLWDEGIVGGARVGGREGEVAQ